VIRDDTSSDSSITLMAFYCSEKGAVPPLSYEESTSDYRAHGPDSVTGSPPRHSTPNTSRSSGRGYTLFEVDNLVSVLLLELELELYLLYCLILGQHMRFVHVAEFSYPHIEVLCDLSSLSRQSRHPTPQGSPVRCTIFADKKMSKKMTVR
jgi:hypothetical protein